jgi:thymidylate synthase
MERHLMNHNYVFTNSTDALPVLLGDLLTDGDEVGSRAGRTMELTHVGTTLTQPWQRELLVPRRMPNLAAQVAETMWVLAGRNDVAWLANYLPRSPDFSDDGVTWRAAYGKRIRSWHGVDQLKYVVQTLKDHALSRQAVISIYDPVVDTQPGKDIPCNNWLSFSNRLGKLDLHVAVRSNDIVWGWSGINVFEWSALQEIVAHLVGVGVGRLHFSTTSLHVYDKHWGRAREIIEAGPYPAPAQDSPRFDMGEFNHDVSNLDDLVTWWMNVENRIRNAADDPAEIDDFPEPMLRSWLRVIKWWWENDWDYLTPLEGTRLYAAAALSVQPSARRPAQVSVPVVDLPAAMIKQIDELHRAKHADYGDSWKRRGEDGIIANIARKVDRLGRSSDHETALDTSIDLLVYLCKYRWWLVDEGLLPAPLPLPHPGDGRYDDDTEPVRLLLEHLNENTAGYSPTLHQRDLIVGLQEMFRQLEAGTSIPSLTLLSQMMKDSFWLVRLQWS